MTKEFYLSERAIKLLSELGFDPPTLDQPDEYIDEMFEAVSDVEVSETMNDIDGLPCDKERMNAAVELVTLLTSPLFDD